MKKNLAKYTAVMMALMLTVTTINGNVYAKDNDESATGNQSVSVVSEEEMTGGETGTENVSSEETTLEGQTTDEESSVGEETSTDEETSTEEESTTEEETTEEETTTEEPTTGDYVIIDEVYKVKDEVLIEYLGNKNDSTVKELNIPDVVKKIDKNVFLDCKYIETVKFSANSKLQELGDYAFKNCSKLSSITLPASVTKLGTRAFDKCTALKSFTIPAKVTSGTEIFGTKNSVTKVTFAKGIETIPAGILRYAYSVKTVKLYSGVKVVGKQAFYKCTALTAISLPSTVTSIKKSAFNGCTALSSVTLPSNLTSIESYAFKKCTGLASLTIYKNCTSFGTNVFSGDKDIVLKVYANSKAKAYARAHNIKWEFTEDEIKRRATNTAIYNNYTSLIKAKDKSKYKLKYLKNYVPQGTCIIGKYIAVSMYHKTLSKKSIIALYNKSTGTYVKRIILPNKDHVGSITNVKGRLVVGLNNISTTDYVGVISYSKILKAKSGKNIKYDYRVKIPGRADFAAYDGTYFWAGHSVNSTAGKMIGYKVTVKNNILTFTQKYSYSIPKNIQGLVVQKAANSTKRTFIFAQSYGRLNNSKLLTYTVKIKTATTIGNVKTEKTLPSMLEGIAMSSKGYMYMVFESGAGLYCGNPDNTSEIQVKNVCRIKYSKISKLQ